MAPCALLEAVAWHLDMIEHGWMFDACVWIATWAKTFQGLQACDVVGCGLICMLLEH
jgi:hypothetical protein